MERITYENLLNEPELMEEIGRRARTERAEALGSFMRQFFAAILAAPVQTRSTTRGAAHAAHAAR